MHQHRNASLSKVAIVCSMMYFMYSMLDLEWLISFHIHPALARPLINLCSFSMTMTCVMFACCTIGSVARNLIIINTRAEMYARVCAQTRTYVPSLFLSVQHTRTQHRPMIMMTVKAMINFLFYQIWHFAASGSFYYQFHSSCHAICFRLRFLSRSTRTHPYCLASLLCFSSSFRVSYQISIANLRSCLKLLKFPPTCRVSSHSRYSCSTCSVIVVVLRLVSIFSLDRFTPTLLYMYMILPVLLI